MAKEAGAVFEPDEAADTNTGTHEVVRYLRAPNV